MQSRIARSRRNPVAPFRSNDWGTKCPEYVVSRVVLDAGSSCISMDDDIYTGANSAGDTLRMSSTPRVALYVRARVAPRLFILRSSEIGSFGAIRAEFKKNIPEARSRCFRGIHRGL